MLQNKAPYQQQIVSLSGSIFVCCNKRIEEVSLLTFCAASPSMLKAVRDSQRAHLSSDPCHRMANYCKSENKQLILNLMRSS